MKVIANKGYALASVDVCSINCKELRQMYELKERVDNVLNSHKEGSEKKEYISDDDLKLASVILGVFTREYADTQTSTFDEELAKMKKAEENTTPALACAPDAPVELQKMEF